MPLNTLAGRATLKRVPWWVCGAFLLLPWSVVANGELRFTEIGNKADLNFVHVNGMVGKRWLLETVGAGVGVLDFDGDGYMDVWLVQGGDVQGGDKGDVLFRNVGRGDQLRFENITARSGVRAMSYGMGIATGDVDNDGDADVFLANYGANQLYENLGDGRFRDVTLAAGLKGAAWSVSASFADIDGDGLLDLYVGNYVDFTPENHVDCRNLAGLPTYCAPETYPPTKDQLFHNRFDEEIRFVDITTRSGIDSVAGPALGVVSLDFDGDDRIDFYVANDGTANFLWHNRGDGTFAEQGIAGFVAFNINGAPEAGMGVDAEDFDQDCDPDLFITHLTTETNTLYINRGGWFVDGTNQSGLAASSAPFTGFGTGWFDADLDGDLDIFSANGAVYPIAAQRDAGDPYPLKQRNQLWLNDGSGRYRELRGIEALEIEEVSRGTAFSDLDNDGDTDIVVSNSNGGPRLLRNDSTPASWLGIVARPGSVVWLDEEPCSAKRAATDGSYASAQDPRLVFGLGGDAGPRAVKVRWEDGTEQRFGPLTTNRYHELRRRVTREEP